VNIRYSINQSMRSLDNNIDNNQIIVLWGHLSSRRHIQFCMVFLLMIVSTFAEVISLGAVLPFLATITAPEHVYQHTLAQPVIQFLNITEPDQLIFPFTIFFIIAVLLAGIIKLTLFYAMTRLSFATGADLSFNVYRRTLYQDYAIHVARNSSEIINGIIGKTGAVAGAMQSVLYLLSSSLLLIGIMVVLLSIDYKLAISTVIGFGGIYLGTIFYTRTIVKENSKVISNLSNQLIKSLQEGLGGIRDVLIDNSQELFVNIFRKTDVQLRRAKANNSIISSSPKHVIEAIGITLIAAIAYILTQQEDGMITAIPILGALAVAAQKLLPALQQAYASYTSLKGESASIQDILDLLQQPLPIHAVQSLIKPISFKKNIKLNDISFRYAKDSPWVIKNLNLNLTKGSHVGFIGVTGCGKSTLLDIIMGLLIPTDGKLMIDNQPLNRENMVEWQAHIAHVPQNIYLSDNTIEENIAFGISKDKINHKQIKNVAKQAQIDEMIEEWEDGYQTYVGERGIRLSGGQRQRIGIARALYKQADVLIFDEATSSLDNETERAIIEAIEGLDKSLTILIIAHRLSTLKSCDQVVELTKSGIKIRNYSEIIN
jgi:ATP-binding cassette, subfamily B, bacterial PglK